MLQEKAGKRSSANGLHNRDAWHSINKSELMQLMETLAERGAITEISAGHN
jgi:hypothetical protein